MSEQRTVHVAYGKTTVPLSLSPDAEWEIIQPHYEAPLPNAQQVFLDLCKKPVGCPTLGDIVQETDRVAVVTSDGTRAVPNHLLIPWLLEVLPCPVENVTVILGTGTHRPNTPQEIEAMVGSEVAKQVRIINHNCFDPSENCRVGQTSTGGETFLDRHYVEADKRIVLGFIEPHFFAGFSGGAKGIVPAIASRDTIFHMHSAPLIADPKSTWGILDENPLRQEIEEMVGLCPPDFMINVTLNLKKEISAIFAGHYQTAHRPGCEHVRKVAMRKLLHRFPIVITSNSGFPLDQNLYQTVKGLSAAARVVEQDGLIFVASECSDGVPN
ncbi:MAG TPA: nickel-dependent lactate racemase, partial [bacterium]|nr:nickel-dependent lactate racemase [bacterium]